MGFWKNYHIERMEGDDWEFVDDVASKEAWNKYIDYCQWQLELLVANSHDYRYYQGEIAKAKSELKRISYDPRLDF